MFTAATVAPPWSPSKFSLQTTQATSPTTSACASVTMNCRLLGACSSAKNDPETAPHPRSVAQPGWVQVTRSECSHSAETPSRSRASKAS